MFRVRLRARAWARVRSSPTAWSRDRIKAGARVREDLERELGRGLG